MKRLLVVILILSLAKLSFAQNSNEPSPEREFIMSCTYGVLAGTLVGAASLAFVDKPGENLQYVARGASIGLYMGIALGVYTVYVLPKQIQKEEEDRLESETGGEQSGLPKVLVFPVMAENKVDGAAAVINILSF